VRDHSVSICCLRLRNDGLGTGGGLLGLKDMLRWGALNVMPEEEERMG
jgi:hypothetical protein